MNSEPKAKRLAGKTRLHRIQVELQQGYNLSLVEAQMVAIQRNLCCPARNHPALRRRMIFE